MRPRKEITYEDELLADRTVHRRYSDGRQEWRSRGHDGEVYWRDDRGGSGRDEPLGTRIVKRVHTDGRVLYGREAGYGRTLWSDEVLTVNRSSLGGRAGAVLAGLGAGVLVGALVAPPVALTAEQEEELREQARSGTGDPGGAGGDGADEPPEYDDWGGEPGLDDGDFG